MIFDFDGPVCDLPAAMPADTLDRLRAIIRAAAIDPSLPQVPARATDVRDVLTVAESIGSDVAAGVDAELSSIEVSATANATPAGYIHEALAACRALDERPP